MIIGAGITIVLSFMVGYIVGRCEQMKEVVYVKERLYRLIKNKCYKDQTGGTVYCGNRYITDFSGDLYVLTKGGYKRCISQK